MTEKNRRNPVKQALKRIIITTASLAVLSATTKPLVQNHLSGEKKNLKTSQENKYTVSHNVQEDYQAVLKESFEHIFWGEEIYVTFAGLFQVNIQYGKPGDAGNMIPNELAEYYREFIHEKHICAHIDCE